MKPRVQKVHFGSDDRTIQGRVFQPDSSEASKMGLLFVDGWRSNQINYESRARTASEALEAVCQLIWLQQRQKVQVPRRPPAPIPHGRC